MLDNIASGKSSKLALNQADMYSDLASLRQQLLSSSMCSPVSPATAQAASTAVQTLSYQECQLLLSVNPLRDDQLDLLTLIKLWNLSLSVVKKRIESNHLLERSQAGTAPRYPNVRLVGVVIVLIYDMFLCVSRQPTHRRCAHTDELAGCPSKSPLRPLSIQQQSQRRAPRSAGTNDRATQTLPTRAEHHW